MQNVLKIPLPSHRNPEYAPEYQSLCYYISFLHLIITGKSRSPRLPFYVKNATNLDGFLQLRHKITEAFERRFDAVAAVRDEAQRLFTSNEKGFDCRKAEKDYKLRTFHVLHKRKTSLRTINCLVSHSSLILFSTG